MFRFFVNPLGLIPGVGIDMRDLSELNPVILEALLERSWNFRVDLPAVNVGHPDRRSALDGRPDHLLNVVLTFPAGVPPFSVPRLPPRAGAINVQALDAQIQAFPVGGAVPGVRWHHLIYAYMIENTRVTEVFRRVVDSCLHGERLGVMSPASQRWLWTTEELFYRDPPSYSIGTLTSSIRPNLAATRSNAYQRAFGMTLNATDDKPAFTIADQANVDFVKVLDELLHETWQGRQNFANAVGARPTDDSKIAELAERLCDMLRSRRIDGALSREEFSAVSMMSWFHATLEELAHPIIIDLRAEANSPEERLFKIAQRVGYPAHGLAKSYLEISEPLSRLLIAIEQGTYNNALAVPALYTPSPPAPPGGPSPDTDTIMTHWSIIRGRDVKARKVAA
ncbi:MAG: hypothetical protein ACRD2A_00490 [Vicinamibacterales bacterium]